MNHHAIPPSHDFVGAGWAFPPALDEQGGIALVSGSRELEQAMQIILMTYPGERPMRPAFGSRLRDFVFRSADNSTAAELALEVRNSLLRWEPRVDVHDVLVEPDPLGAEPPARRDRLRGQAHQRPPQPGVPLLHDPRRRRASTDGDRRTQPRRSAVPGPRRRRQADGDGALPGVDRPQRVRPGRDADRDVRVHDRPAALPAQPRAGPAVRQVPRADRDPAVPADRGAHRADVLAVGAGDLDARDPARHAGGDRASRRRGAGRVQHARRPGDRADASWRSWRRVARSRGRACSRTDELRVGAAVSAFDDVPDARTTSFSSGSTRPRPATRSRSGSTARSTASVSIRPIRRCSGRRGTAPTGRRATSSTDETGGLNRRGDIVLHLPPTHAASMLEEKRAGWVRARVTRCRRRSTAVPLVADDPRSRRDDCRWERPGRRTPR